MKPIYSKAGLAQLDRIVQPGMLCAFDFDGTLAPIARQPALAVAPPEVLRRLIELAKHAPVAILSGRAAADVRARLTCAPALAFEPAYLVGNHGLEEGDEGARCASRYETVCCAWQRMLDTAVRERPELSSGVQIENKRFSLSIHYRLARDHAAAARLLSAICAKLAPAPRLIAGKCVLNVLPAGAPDKGAALARLIQASGARSAMYIGDDITDEDVFRLARPELLSIRVEHEAASAAAFFLPQQSDIVQLLDELIRRIAARA